MSTTNKATDPALMLYVDDRVAAMWHGMLFIAGKLVYQTSHPTIGLVMGALIGEADSVGVDQRTVKVKFVEV